MAYSLDDSLRREHRVGASLQPFQFNDTFSEDKFNHDIHWAANHLWHRSLESQRDLIDIKRFNTNTRYFTRSVARNCELGLPYYSYTLEIPFNNVNFFDTREAKRRNVGKLVKEGCTRDCDEHHVNSTCISAHHVDPRKYPNLYTLQDTYTNRKMFNRHLLIFVDGKMFTDMMLFVDIDRLILVIEPDVTANDGTTIKLSQLKSWIADELSIDIIGIPWSPIYTFDGDPRDITTSGTISLDKLKKSTDNMNINSTEWMVCFTTDDVNVGEMTTIFTEVQFHEESGENLFIMSDILTGLFSQNIRTHCEAFPIPNLYGISKISTNRLFQIPINGNAIPTENIIVWKNNKNGSLDISTRSELSLYYPNVYKVEPRFIISSSHDFSNYEIDRKRFQEKVNKVSGIYRYEAHRNLSIINNTHTNVVVDAEIFEYACNFTAGEYKFTFTPEVNIKDIVGDFEVKLNEKTFSRFVRNKTGTYQFTCINSVSWEYGGNIIRLSDYGISIPNGKYGTGDSITIVYTNLWQLGDSLLTINNIGINIEGTCEIGDTFEITYQDMAWYIDDEIVDMKDLGIDILNSDVLEGTSITVDFRNGDPQSTQYSIMWFQSFEDATTFDNPIKDYMTYDSQYANNVISNALPETLVKYIPLELKYDYKDHIRNMKYTTTQSEFNYKAKRLIEILKDNTSLYEYIYDQLMTRTAYENHTNTKIVWNFGDIESWKHYTPHIYGVNDDSDKIFTKQISNRLYVNNHDELPKNKWAEFKEPCYKFVISHDSPKYYAYSTWIDGKSCAIKYIYYDGFKTVIYLPAHKISNTSIVEFEIMKVPNNRKYVTELDIGDLDNSVELPRIFPDVSPQNIMVCIRREVSVNKSDTNYNPKLYDYLSDEGIEAGENFGVKYFYEVAPAYEMQWLLFGRRKYVDGIAEGGTKITATTIPKLEYRDTLTNYKGSNLRTMFGEEFITANTKDAHNAVIVTANEEPTASGFYPTERRRFYQYIPYGKDAEPIYITPMGKPTKFTTQEVVYGYTRDENNKIIKWHTQHMSLKEFFSRVTVVSIPKELTNFSIVADTFAEMVSYVNDEYVFEYSAADGWHRNGLEHIDMGSYGMEWNGGVFEGATIVINYEAIPYLANQHVIIQNTDIYKRYLFTVNAFEGGSNTSHTLKIDKFFDDPSPERFRIFCNGYLMEHHYDIEMNMTSFSGNFIRGDSISVTFKNGYKEPYAGSPSVISYQNEGLEARILDNSKLISNLDVMHTSYKVTFTAHFDANPDGTRSVDWSVEAVALSDGPFSITERHTRLESWGIDIKVHLDTGSLSDVNPPKIIVDVPKSEEFADIMIEYLPYKLNRVFINTSLMDEFVDCGSDKLTRPISLKYYDIYLDGVKLYEKDIRIITATKFLIIGKNIRASTVSIYERAHDTDLYGNESKLPRSLIDSLCDNDNRFTDYLTKKYLP